jgi:hypothetical protein
MLILCCLLLLPRAVLLPQVDVTSKTEGKVDNSHMLVKYDARLRDNVASGVVAEVTDTVQVHATAHGGVCLTIAGRQQQQRVSRGRCAAEHGMWRCGHAAMGTWARGS